MAKVNNPALANNIRKVVEGAQANGDVWVIAKSLISASNEDDAAEILAADKNFMRAAKASAKAYEASRKNRPAPEPGTLRHAIANYEPKTKSEVFVKADGTEVACTPAQKAAWEQGRTRFESTKVAGDTKVTQDAKVEALAKALELKPELLGLLEGLLK